MTQDPQGPTPPGPLPRWLQLRIYLRSLALQASWNHQRMQNLGLLTTLCPWRRARDRTQQGDRLFCRRYYGFFNTNPYLANFLIGGLLRLEQDRHDGAEISDDQLATFRDSLARAFASFGDQLFWMTLRPGLFALVCLIGLRGHVYAPLALVLIFAVWQLVLRWIALNTGYQLGLDIVELLGRPRWHLAIAWIRRLGMFLTGALLGHYLLRVGEAEWALAQPGLWVAVISGLALPLALRKLLPGEVLVWLGLIPAAVAVFAI
jgi:PTS system mannose-specific IID component